MQIYLVRHGEASGQGDSPLSKRGRNQIKKTSRKLKNIAFDKIYTSDLLRAKESCEIYHKMVSSIKAEIRPESREIYRVIVGGLPKPDTEPLRQTNDEKRIRNFFEEIIDQKSSRILVFTHGNVIRYFVGRAIDLERNNLYERLDLGPGSVTILESNKEKMKVICINDTCHLGKLASVDTKITRIE